MSHVIRARATFAWPIVAAAAVGLLSLATRGAWAAEGPTTDAISAQLAAGEFSAALDSTKTIPPGPAQDAALAQIAAAQIQAGARGSAGDTVNLIRDDRARTDAFGAFGNPRPTKNKKTGKGGNEADFGPLIDLITQTISPTSWVDSGGSGSVKEFASGVYVDPKGVLHLLAEDRSGGLAAVRRSAANADRATSARKASPIRKISLTRLEREAQRLAALGRQPSEDMRVLAGLQRIKYVLVYPDSRDIVIAGPAGDWQYDAEERLVAKDNGRPVLRLDDLVVVLRHMLSSPDAKFGCSITPTQEGLARTQEFVAESNKHPLKQGERDGWLKGLRDHMGRQLITMHGIDPNTRVGRVIVEADYRMKLVGVGLEDGVLGVPSYLSMIQVPKGQAPPALDVLRWWFTLNYDALEATKDHDGFELRGQGVKVLSENELLTLKGERVHTGNSDVLNSEFARNFTQHYLELSAKYPIYADLQNVFDLALVGALLRAEKAPERIGWQLAYFGDPNQYRVAKMDAPQEVDTVINHRIVNKSLILVGVSGGVSVDPKKLVAPEAIHADYGPLNEQRASAKPKTDVPNVWWWD